MSTDKLLYSFCLIAACQSEDANIALEGLVEFYQKFFMQEQMGGEGRGRLKNHVVIAAILHPHSKGFSSIHLRF